MKVMGMAQTPDISELLTGSMDLADYKDKWVYNEDYDCYSLEYVVYCENTVDPVKECMNIYVPAAYMNADGTINETGEINGYTAQSAPIIYKNGVGGYAEADASKISDKTKEISGAGICICITCQQRQGDTVRGRKLYWKIPGRSG